MNFERLREFVLAMLLDLFDRLKPERVQDRTLPEETPMTVERIGNRAAESGFDLIWAPVAINKRYRHADFAEAVAFVAEEVARIAAEQGHSPNVEIDRGDVTVTLGIPIPGLLSEADFDVADALKAATEVEAEPDFGPLVEPAPPS